MMSDVYPELNEERKSIDEWLGSEEESFGRTLEQGTALLAELIDQAKAANTSWIGADDAFKLHDTFGFPYDLTRELLAEQGLSVDDDGFHELMEEQRERARSGAATAHGSEDDHDVVRAFARDAGFETRLRRLRAHRDWRQVVASLARRNSSLLTKFPESPFYPEGGGQVADSGVVVTESGRGRVTDVFRIGDDQAVEVELVEGELKQGEPARLEVDAAARHATACNHTATHLLHAALRAAARHPRAPGRLGRAARQAALRLHPRQGPESPTRSPGSRTTSTAGSSRATRCALS